jgi:hypothetical protein
MSKKKLAGIKERSWFERHLNWTMVLTWAGSYLISFIVAVLGMLISPNISDDAIIVVLAITSLLVTIAGGWWVLRKKNRSLAWLLICWTWFFLLIQNHSLMRDEYGRTVADYNKAIADHSRVIELNPSDAQAYYNRSLDYQNKGQVPEAVSDLEKCIGLSTDRKLTEAAQQTLSEIRDSLSVECGRRLTTEQKVERISKKKIAGIIVVSTICLIIVIAIVGSLVTTPPTNTTPSVITGKIVVGTKVEVAQSTIGTAGGTITVNKPGDVLDGYQLQVPANSYDSSRTFQVSYAPIKSHSFGGDFHPISPLIDVENGGGYSNEIMTVKIPVQIPDGDFAMAFFYDSATGELEGMPLVTEDQNSVTVATRHFTNYLVAAIEKYKLEGVVKSGFLPGFDDWQFPNMGSYLEPEGHCAGQSITAMWYYYEKFLKGSHQLYGLYNYSTPEVWEDDIYAYRLASVIQHDYDINLDTLVYQFMLNYSRNMTAQQQVNAFAYAILATGQPQFVGLLDTIKGGGHAMIVYRVDNGNLSVADPNYPGNLTRKIEFANNQFVPYYSGDNKQTIDEGYVKEYNQILYMSISALIDSSQIASRWGEMENQTVGNGQFPEYTLLASENGGTPRELKDGFTTDKNTLTIEATEETGTIFSSLLGTSIYQEDHWLQVNSYKNPVVDTSSKVTLKEGKNKLGIWVCARMVNADATAFWTWVDFQWITVTYTPSAIPQVTIVNALIKAVWYPDEVVPQGVTGWGSYEYEGSVTLDFGGLTITDSDIIDGILVGAYLTPKNFSELQQEFYFIQFPSRGFDSYDIQPNVPLHQVTFEFSASGELFIQNDKPAPKVLTIKGLHLEVRPSIPVPLLPGQKGPIDFEVDFDIVISSQ